MTVSQQIMKLLPLCSMKERKGTDDTVYILKCAQLSCLAKYKTLAWSRCYFSMTNKLL